MSSTSQSVPSLTKGITLDHRYEIIEVLGQGGFGITYLAHDYESNTKVVIKENAPLSCAIRDTYSQALLPAPGSYHDDCESEFQKSIDDFCNEAHVLRTLNHPGIVQVTDFFVDLGTAYFVMPYIFADSLKNILRTQHVLHNQHNLTKLLSNLLITLSYLHGVHRLHRDIKPGNILLVDNIFPILIDFGAARSIRRAKHTTVLTPGYTPYEQISGGDIGPWSDIYALGATMYRIITGKLYKPSSGSSDTSYLLSSQQQYLSLYGYDLLYSIDKSLCYHHSARWQNANEWLAHIHADHVMEQQQEEHVQNQIHAQFLRIRIYSTAEELRGGRKIRIPVYDQSVKFNIPNHLELEHCYTFNHFYNGLTAFISFHIHIPDSTDSLWLSDVQLY